MPSTIVLNTNNVVQDGNNNSLVYNFPNSVSFPHHEIAVQSIDMYYSWTNINSSPLMNNKFKYYFPTNTLGEFNTYNITLPDGLYQISDINAYLQSQMIANGTYLIDNNGQNVYYIELALNPTQYSVQLNLFVVPSALLLPTGWSLPSNYQAGGLPLAPTIAGFSVQPSSGTSNFNQIIGFPSTFDQIPLVTSTKSYTSSQYNLAPEVQPNPCLFLSVTGIANKYAIPNTIIFSIAPNVAFGALINIQPPQFSWNTLLGGTYNQFKVQFLGADYKPIKLLDPNITIVLVIRDTEAELPSEVVNLLTASK